MSYTTRPINETISDIQNETRVIRQFCDAWGMQFVKQSMSDRVDFRLYRDGCVVALAEVKCRSNDRRRYPTFFVSQDKANEAIRRADEMGVPCLLIVSFTDGIHYCVLTAKAISLTSVGGRSDRGQNGDIELMAHIDTKLMVPLLDD